MIREYIRNPYALSSIAAYCRGTWRIFVFFGCHAAATVEVLLHRDFGVRYLPTMAVGLGMLVLVAVVTAGCLPLLPWFTLIVAIQTVRHTAATLRDQGSVRRHSQSSGEPLLIWRAISFSPAFARLVGEPGLCFAIGVTAVAIDPGLSCWLLAAGITLLVKDVTARSRLRQRALDTIDSRLEVEEFTSAVNRRTRAVGDRGERTHNARLARRIPRPRQHRV